MVKVIPVHNFLDQIVVQIEEHIASCVASLENSQEFLLLAFPNHCIEVRNLMEANLNITSSFPTVDLVEKIIHCAKGNYVATIEVKQVRENVKYNKFVRIYLNWNNKECQAMRARIAGRVTPCLNRPQNTLEMIELPLDNQPSVIACCQTTGNLLVVVENILFLYEYKLHTQNLSKLKFIDFEVRPWTISLNFKPSNVEIVEDFLSVMDSCHFIVFHLIKLFYQDIDHLPLVSSTTLSSNKEMISGNNKISTEFQISDQLLLTGNQYNCVHWDQLKYNNVIECESLITKGVINEKCDFFTIELPTVSLERISPGHVFNPFIMNSEDTKVYINNTSSDYNWSKNFTVKYMLQLEIAKVNKLFQNFKNRIFFKSFILKPLYLKTKNCNEFKNSVLKSNNHKNLSGLICFLCTEHEGYIYHFNIKDQFSNAICLKTYSFTGKVIHVAIGNMILYALTEAGLESYTLHLPHHMKESTSNLSNLRKFSTDTFKPVCLIGLRPFFGIQKMLITDNNIVLIEQINNLWTLNCLKLPKPDNIYYDIINAAKNYKSTNTTTYLYLLEEAHSMLSITKDVEYINKLSEDEYSEKLKKLFFQSCALLADYYAKADCELEQHICVKYYKMSGLSPSEVLNRKSTCNAPGLTFYLREILTNLTSVSDSDELFHNEKVFDIVSKVKTEDIVILILRSIILREYATAKLIRILESKVENNLANFVIAVLYVHAQKRTSAELILKSVPDQELQIILLDYPEILFDKTFLEFNSHTVFSFTEFSAILISCKAVLFSKILIKYIQRGILSLHEILQVFIKYLPSRVGKDGQDAAVVMQLFLEIYLFNYFMKWKDKNKIIHNSSIVEALKILVRTHLGKLLLSKNSNAEIIKRRCYLNKYDEDTYLFETKRPKYLDKMFPNAKCYTKSLCYVNSKKLHPSDSVEIDKNSQIEILKLQALIASDILPSECMYEIERLLAQEKSDSSIAFETLCNRNTNVVTKFLIKSYPQAVFQYAKDMFTVENEWISLIELLEEQILKINSNNKTKFFFEQILLEALKYVAEIFPLKSLHFILPKDNGEIFEKFSESCSNIVHAEHVRSLIMETGRQLLLTLNL